MSKSSYYIIQLHAIMALLGYWFFHAIVTLAFGESSQQVSIIYDGFQLAISLYVIVICRRDFRIGGGNSELRFMSILLALYTLRMMFDMVAGPFARTVTSDMFLQDILLTVFSTFISVWAVIISRKWINIDNLVHLIFWVGILTIIAVLLSAESMGTINSYEEERMDGGQALGSLVLVKVGALVVIAAFHLLMNPIKHHVYKFFYLAGIAMGIWIALASGARGGVVSLVIAMGIYSVFASRKKLFLTLLVVAGIILFVMNLVPILTWLSDYFPIFGKRMLATILENDQSFRQEIRQDAIRVTLEHPLFGYSYRLYDTPSGFRAHNGILEVSIALGIPITILFLYFIYYRGIVMVWKSVNNRRMIFPSIAAVFVLVGSISSSSISNSVFNICFCLLSIAFHYNYNFNNNSSIQKGNV